MNTLIVFAQPNPQSLNARLKDKAVQVLQLNGHQVVVSDLYQMGFRAVAGPQDFQELEQPHYFDLQHEQRTALVNQSFTQDIVQEHQKLLEADLIIFQFPFWWYGMPAILKGYVDRVFSVGFAYGGGQALEGKKGLVCTTTGAGTDWLNDRQPPGNIQRILHPVLYGTFAFCGMYVLEPHVIYKAKRLTEEEKREQIEAYGRKLARIEQWPVLDY